MKNIIDCRGLKCPQPVINTKKYFDSIEEGEASVIVDNEVAKNNVMKLAASSGWMNSFEQKEGEFYITIAKGRSCKGEQLPSPRDNETLTIVISSDRLGSGDDELGGILMKSYLYALAESERVPDDLIFLNSGVKLTTEGSDSIDSLKKLLKKGHKYNKLRHLSGFL
jgi:selenium metabolism protein YedF